MNGEGSEDTVSVEATAERVDGVTLVTATVHNALTTTQVVSVESRLDGPIWPPTERGVVDPEWEGGTWRGRLDPGEMRGLGFASPATPVDPPVVMESTRRATPEDRRPTGRILAELDDWMPPRSVARRR